MDFDEYQKSAQKTAIYPGKGIDLWYPALGLNGEAGEVAEKVKKLMRDHDGVMSPEYKDMIAQEIGDVLWYIADISYEIGVPLKSIAIQNLEKLASRKERGVIKGNGDNR